MLATTAGEKHAENAAPLLSGPAAPGEPAHERANAAQQQATAELRTEKGLQEAMETAKSTFGFRRLEGPLRFGLSPQPFTDDEQNDLGRKRSNRIGYLEGLRGLLALEVMLWSFFRIMAPGECTRSCLEASRGAARGTGCRKDDEMAISASCLKAEHFFHCPSRMRSAIATDTDIDGTRPAVFVNAAPMWMNSLRKALQPLFWDGHLQYTFSFILSGRVLAESE